jgi:hypothetical protein
MWPRHLSSGERRKVECVTVLTMRRVHGQFVVTSPDIEKPVTFETRAQARYWCYVNFRGSPIREVGAVGRKKGAPSKKSR